MSKYLLIVESPAKVKTIQKFLGSSYKVDSSLGHIRDLPKSTLGVDVENGFEPKYVTIKGKAEIMKKLKKEAKDVKVLLATDPDREGEAISWHLANILGIKDDEKCRITFNEITEKAVKNAIASPRSINMNLVDSQQARRIMDRLVGYKVSPLLWKKVRKGLSAGRVQSVATRIICDRDEEIANFKPEEYWTITAHLYDEKIENSLAAKFHGKDGRKTELKSKEETDKILDYVKGKDFIVAKVKKSEKPRAPQPPFITSTLQQEAARKFGYPLKKTMIVAQQLYEGVEIKGQGSIGLITYMRSDSLRVSDEAKDAARKYVMDEYGPKFLPDHPRIYKNKSAAQDAHEAIRPTHVEFSPQSVKISLTGEQFKIYKLIWERFLASQMSNAIFDTITADINAGDCVFKVSASKVKFPGFMKLYTEGKDEEAAPDKEEEENKRMPYLSDGQKLNLDKIVSEQKFTQPPLPYTEATLVKLLEEKGIGRPSTYATIISTIMGRDYVIKEKKFLYPTDTGRTVNEIMKKGFKDIVDIGYTAGMENRLDAVEDGGKKYIDVLKEFWGPFSEQLKLADDNIEAVRIPDEETDIVCDKCNERKMIIKVGRYGKFLACPGYPECKNARPYNEDLGINCPLCGGKIKKKITKAKKAFYWCEKYPECDFKTFDQPVPDKKCPKCGSFMLKKQYSKNGALVCAKPDCGFSEKGSTDEE